MAEISSTVRSERINITVSSDTQSIDKESTRAGLDQRALLDQLELSSVKTEALTDLHAHLTKLISGEENLTAVLTNPEKLQELTKLLREAHGELQKMVGAEVTDGAITQPLRTISSLLRVVDGFNPTIAKSKEDISKAIEENRAKQPYDWVPDGKGGDIGDMEEKLISDGLEHQLSQMERSMLQRIGALTDQCLSELDVAIPFCDDKVEDARSGK